MTFWVLEIASENIIFQNVNFYITIISYILYIIYLQVHSRAMIERKKQMLKSKRKVWLSFYICNLLRNSQLNKESFVKEFIEKLIYFNLSKFKFSAGEDVDGCGVSLHSVLLPSPHCLGNYYHYLPLMSSWRWVRKSSRML